MQLRIFVGYPSIHWMSIGCPQVGLGYLTDIQHPQFADLDMELISKSADMPQPTGRHRGWVKTLGRRNAKPTANRAVVEEYIQHQQRTPPIENEAGEIPGMEVQRKRQAIVRAD